MNKVTSGGYLLEEDLCHVQIAKDDKYFVAKVQTNLGGYREYRAKTIEKVLEQMIDDLQEEFDSIAWRFT